MHAMTRGGFISRKESLQKRSLQKISSNAGKLTRVLEEYVHAESSVVYGGTAVPCT